MTRLQRTLVGVAAVVVGAAIGSLGGWLWWSWWGPAPTGKVYDTPAGPHWYPDPFDPGITRDFAGTGQFVVIAFGLALLIGVAGGLILRDHAVFGLGIAVACSVSATAWMVLVGRSQSPGDPQDKVSRADIGDTLPGHLDVASIKVKAPQWVADLVNADQVSFHIHTPYFVWPVGAMLGYLVVMLALNSRTPSGEWQRPGQPSAEPALQD